MRHETGRVGWSKPSRLAALCIAVSGLIVASSCGNALTCAIQGDNIRGRVFYTTRVPKTQRTKIKVQASSTAFVTVDTQSSEDNGAGLLVMSFGLCVANDVNFRIRAFEDTDGDASWSSGEPTGRDDELDTGHAGFVTRNVPSGGADDWERINGIEIYLDETTSQ